MNELIDRLTNELIDRLNNYFDRGGLFNPELMEQDKVRTLLRDCRLQMLKREQHPEICICAALRLGDGRVIRGHRHDDCIQTSIKWGVEPLGSDQGFQTSRNRFVGRTEAMQLQRAAGLIKPEHHSDILFSEDLY